MNIKKLALFLLPLVVAGSLIGGGYAFWQFTENTPITQPDASVTVEPGTNITATFSEVWVWFGEDVFNKNEFEKEGSNFASTPDNPNLKIRSPSLTIDAFNVLFSSPMKIRGYLKDINNTSPINLDYTIKTSTDFQDYFNINIKRFDEDGNEIPLENKLSNLSGTKNTDNTGTYVEFPSIYIDTTYKDEKLPQTHAMMGDVVNVVKNATTPLISIDLTIKPAN